MNSTPSEPGSDKVQLHEALYWDCQCGHRQMEYWIAEELSSKHLDRIRRKGKAVVQTYWYVRIPKKVRCEQCGATFATIEMVVE